MKQQWTLKRVRICFFTLRQGVTLSYQEGILVLDLGEHGSGRTTRSVAVSELNNLRTFFRHLFTRNFRK